MRVRDLLFPFSLAYREHLNRINLFLFFLHFLVQLLNLLLHFVGVVRDLTEKVPFYALRHTVPGDGKWSAQAWRQETREVIARVREKVEASLGER